MKKIAVFIFLPVMALCILSLMNKGFKKKDKNRFLVTGSIMQTVKYCGGAKPTQEMVDRSRTPAGIPFGKLFIKKSVMNEVWAKTIETIHADADGNFSIHLPKGDYCLVEEWKIKPFNLPLSNKNQTVDSICYRKLYDTCDFHLKITSKNIQDLRFIFHRPCFYDQPCISYKGPMPHTAAPR